MHTLCSRDTNEINILVIEPEINCLREAKSDFKPIKSVSVSCNGTDVAVLSLKLILLGISLGFR